MKLKQMFIGGSRNKLINNQENDGKHEYVVLIPNPITVNYWEPAQSQIIDTKMERYISREIVILDTVVTFWVIEGMSQGEATARIREAILWPFER